MSMALRLRMGLGLAEARRHDRWTCDRLEAFQRARLRALLRFAAARSPYYREALGGGASMELSAVPVLTKTVLVERWNDVVTDRALRLEDAFEFLARRADPTALWRGRYHLMTTSGTTGLRAVFPSGPREWARTMVTVARLTSWRKGLGPSRGNRLAIVMAGADGAGGAPMGARMAATLHALMPETLFIDVSAPLAQQVAALNAAQPILLAGYAGPLALLADEQAAGRLRIRPAGINASSEVLTPAMAKRIEAAFGVRPHNAYAMTETGTAGGTCWAHDGLHVQEDMSILEIVDDAYRPVPPGVFGSRVLVTNLWARTLPLIRYEIPDRVRLTEEPCACGLPFARIAEIDGRASEVLTLPGADGRAITVTPSQIQRLMAEWPVAGWQIVRRAEGLGVRITAAAALDREAMAQRLSRQLQAMGANGVSVDVEIVPAIPLSSAGKTIRFLDAASPGRAISGPP